METFTFVGTTISQDLKWETNIKSILKKTQWRMYFLQQMMKLGLPQQLLSHFYTAVIEPILRTSIMVWFRAATDHLWREDKRSVWLLLRMNSTQECLSEQSALLKLSDYGPTAEGEQDSGQDQNSVCPTKPLEKGNSKRKKKR
ncbi:hypothetical protein SRHO_G00198190 [Serrasalmus rhombeus]